jgi:N-acetylmuramoyl-L-alanine amidase-like protein
MHGNMLARFVEWRARRIPDPIERLRYLRRVNRPATIHRRKVWSWSAAAFCAVVMLIAVRNTSDATGHRSAVPAPQKFRSAPAGPAEVWLVEKAQNYELYSNGLRIEDRLTVSNRARSFVAFDRRDRDLSPGLWSSYPVGIVYHTTESHNAPFEASQNQAIKRQGEKLLEFVREKQAYHFVIDRFGRVHRIVAESDSANHAGRSVWADAKWVYINLNSSFLGISFEGETRDLKENLTPAQIHAGRVLTEMLRYRYQIAKENCVTHAQVSVNPDNMRIGYHTDWAGNFPFHEMGLEDNYAQPIPALFLFGYEYDPTFVESTGARLWKGLMLAEERLLEEATVEGRTVAEYKKILQKRYREKLTGMETKGDKS